MAIVWDERSKAREYLVKAGDTLTSPLLADVPIDLDEVFRPD